MSSDMRAAFMRDIIEHPADDTPRLIFADWLEDHGEPERAEFIRVQCELDRFPWARNVRESDYDARDGIDMGWKRAFLLHDQEMRLLWLKAIGGDRCNWSAWCWAESRDEDGEPVILGDRGSFTVTPHGSPGLRGNSCGCTVDSSFGLVQQSFRRGFVAEVHCSLAAWERHGPRIVRAQPIEVARATDKEPYDHHDYFVWADEGDSQLDNKHQIPSQIFAKLPSHDNHLSREDAFVRLSKALIAWAWSQPVDT